MIVAIASFEITDDEMNRLLQLEEGHFADAKAIEIAPGKLTKTIAAFSNADGGDVFVGIAEDKQTNTMGWKGFPSPEAANGQIQIFESLFPLGDGFSYSFLHTNSGTGLVLKIEIQKGRSVKMASDGIAYVRRGAQNIPYTTPEDLDRLKRNKGLTSFETELINTDPNILGRVHTI